MRILIVQENLALGDVWANHLRRMGAEVELVSAMDEAVSCILKSSFDVIVLDLVLKTGSALSIADVAHLCQPEANLIFVTDTTFFSDGSIFAHVANVRAMLQIATPPEDLAAIVHHYAQDASRARVGVNSQAVG